MLISQKYLDPERSTIDGQLCPWQKRKRVHFRRLCEVGLRSPIALRRVFSVLQCFVLFTSHIKYISAYFRTKLIQIN